MGLGCAAAVARQEDGQRRWQRRRSVLLLRCLLALLALVLLHCRPASPVPWTGTAARLLAVCSSPLVQLQGRPAQLQQAGGQVLDA